MWDERYSSQDYFYGKQPNDFLRDNIQLIQNGESVLCLAEGEGRNAVFIAGEVKSAHVTAVDSSKAGLEKTKALAQEKGVNVETVHADLSDFDLGQDKWDVIVSIWCHLPSELRKMVHAGAVKALKSGGRLILEAYTPDQLRHGTGGPKSVDMLMQLSILKEELAGLDLVTGRECEREIHEGQGHSGLSAVVQVVARKA
ncbi:MAG: class I SAM-dependent methyltransferase [Proteobacteria bacterium]|nr:class I SAM-dependent methyltransferase [Pseudomonadota bacterium]